MEGAATAAADTPSALIAEKRQFAQTSAVSTQARYPRGTRLITLPCPTLGVTGYAENAAIRAGFLGTNMAMITKPFSIENLSAKIAEMTPA